MKSEKAHSEERDGREGGREGREGREEGREKDVCKRGTCKIERGE